MTKLYSDQDFQSIARARNLPAPANDDEPARLAELKSYIEGIKNKDPVVVRTQGNINLAAPGATVDGETLISGSRELGSFLAANQTAQAENGLYIWNGASTPATRAADANSAAELNNALVRVTAGTDLNTNWRQTATVTTLGTDPVVWSQYGTSVAAASETAAGIAELATQAETDAGSDDSRIVTPLKLATWSGKPKRYSATFGDGAATQYDLTHNLGTRDVTVQIYRVASPYDQVLVDNERLDTNTVRLKFASPPASNEFRAVIVG